jgi:hypothetical protein
VKNIKILCLLALTLTFWIVGASMIAFGNAETFGFSWAIQIAGSTISGWLLIIIYSRKYLNEARLNITSRLIILTLIFCAYLSIPAGAVTDLMASNMGIGENTFKTESIKNLGYPLLLYILLLDAINTSLAVFACVTLILFISHLLKIRNTKIKKINSSE